MHVRHFCVSVFAFLALTVANAAAAACPTGFQSRTISGYNPSPFAACFRSGLQYGTNSAYHRLDIYRPEAAAPSAGFPTIVYVHGGGFVGGSRLDVRSGTDANIDVAEDWAAVLRQVTRGFAVVSIDYRLAGSGVRFTEQRHDVQQAIRWVKREATTYGFNANKIATWGHSAGATLLTLAAGYRAENPNEPAWNFGTGYTNLANYTDTVNLVIGYAGMYDVNQLIDPNYVNCAGNPQCDCQVNPQGCLLMQAAYTRYGAADGVSQYLGCDHFNGSELSSLPWCKTASGQTLNHSPATAPYPEPQPAPSSPLWQASPIRYVNGPPTLLVYGVDDGLIPPISGQPQAKVFLLVKAMAGQPIDILELPGGAGHGAPTQPEAHLSWNTGAGTNRNGSTLAVRDFIDWYLGYFGISP